MPVFGKLEFIDVGTAHRKLLIIDTSTAKVQTNTMVLSIRTSAFMRIMSSAIAPNVVFATTVEVQQFRVMPTKSEMFITNKRETVLLAPSLRRTYQTNHGSENPSGPAPQLVPVLIPVLFAGGASGQTISAVGSAPVITYSQLISMHILSLRAQQKLSPRGVSI